VPCPRCGSVAGSSDGRCASCRAADDDATLVCVFRTGDAGLLPLLESTLEAAGIPFLVQGREALGLFPLGSFAVGLTDRRSLGASILVPRERADEARALLECEGPDGPSEPEGGA